MSVKIVIKPNTYFDSVSLMSISTRANKLDGVEQAFVAMATEMNKGVLKNLGLLTPELEQAKNGDLMIVINGKSGVDNEQLLAEIEELFNTKAQSGSHEARYATFCSGQQKLATALEFFQYRFSDSFGGNPPLYSCGLSAL